jgi:hypothetical protein
MVGRPLQPALRPVDGAEAMLAASASASQGLTVQRTFPDPPAPHGGAMTGVVVGERQEPIARAQVQAFSVTTLAPEMSHPAQLPLRASGAMSTDADGRFRIDGLESGVYVVAAQTVPFLPSHGSPRTAPYGTTFHPSTLDVQQRTPVSVEADGITTARIALVPGQSRP